MLYLRVDKKSGEKYRKSLLEKGLFDSRRMILREGEYLLFPVLEEVCFPGSDIVEREAEVLEKKPASLHDALKDKIAPDLLLRLPRAFDLIGDIAVLEIPSELESQKKLIGETLLETFPQIKVAVKKKSSIGSEFRTRDVEFLAGEKRKETYHREYDCLYHLDVETSYFSPRLGTERKRVASQVKEGERVLVLFAGVGPYPVLIAKKTPAAEVVAVELNPEAVDYMRENVALNKVDVEVVLGDAREEAQKHGLFDRVAMPLPKDAGDFLDSTLPAVKPGGIVHLYDFSAGDGESARKVEKICEGLGYQIEILDEVKCGSFSPTIYRVCVDFKVL